MTIHRSLKLGGVGSAKRNVLSRVERLEKMGLKGQWDPDKSVLHLPKYKIEKIKLKKKKKEEEVAAGAEAGTAATPAAGTTTPATGTKTPATGGKTPAK